MLIDILVFLLIVSLLLRCIWLEAKMSDMKKRMRRMSNDENI